MLFTDEFIESLREDPVRGTISLCDIATAKLQIETSDKWSDDHFSVLLEAYSLIMEIIASGLLPVTPLYPSVVGRGQEQCAVLYKFIQEIRSKCVVEESKLRVATLRDRFRTSLGNGFVYEFSQGDLERVQTLVNQLRDLIGSTTQFDKEHQKRLLRRLERLQAEMHKKVSDLDRFWGLIGDAGVVVGKLGKDAKPIVDRIREIADIVWQTQSRAEELPSGTKLPQLENKPTAGAEEV